MTRRDGLTDEEGAVMDALIEAVNAYSKLPTQHPDEPQDFADAIHRCQDALAIRIARRHYPQGWPVKAMIGVLDIRGREVDLDSVLEAIQRTRLETGHHPSGLTISTYQESALLGEWKRSGVSESAPDTLDGGYLWGQRVRVLDA